MLLRYRLRTLLFVVCVSCTGLACFVPYDEWKEERALNLLQKRRYEITPVYGPFAYGLASWMPWRKAIVSLTIIELEGDSENGLHDSSINLEDFSSLQSVNFSNLGSPLKPLPKFGRLLRLKALNATGCIIDSRAISYMTYEVPQLRDVYLSGSALQGSNNTDFSMLFAIPSLETIELRWIPIAPGSLINARQSELKSFQSIGCGIRDDDILELANCRELELVAIQSEMLTDKCLGYFAVLAKLPSLKQASVQYPFSKNTEKLLVRYSINIGGGKLFAESTVSDSR